MTSRDLAGCPLVAAFAEAQRAINEHIAKTARIAFSPTNSPRRRGPPQAIQRKDANRLDFIPPRADRKTASSMECFQVHVIKGGLQVFVEQPQLSGGATTHASAFPRRMARGSLAVLSPRSKGSRECRARAAPAASRGDERTTRA